MAAKTTLGWMCGLVMLASGCGGGLGKHADAPRPSSPAAYPAQESAAGGVSSEAAPSARSESARDVAPSERPGLGTEWGETRTSRVHDVSFTRESSRPFAATTLHYDDRRGAEALGRQRGRRDGGTEFDVANGAVTVAIQDADGQPFDAIRTAERNIVIGHAGERYSIVLTNHTSHRFESVVTVDGLDVVSGKPGTTEQRGYVLGPFATLSIDGFRQSASAVASFRFASVADSYAAQMGPARNVGVIGAAFFAERGDSLDSIADLRLRETANPFPADPRFARPPRR